jgi:hypothetical protein
MADGVLIDNDIVLKTCSYDAVDELIACVSGRSRTIHVLGVAKFVLTKAIKKRANILNKERAFACVARLMASVKLLEPDVDELALAAELEETAQSREVELDGGESQLLAVLIQRAASLLLTGDKRAIRAIEPVVRACGYETNVAGRVACLEQVIMAMIGRHGAEIIRAKICSEAAADISLAICFSCVSQSRSQESIVEGLVSYINDLRRSAPSVLIDSNDLSAVIPHENSVR